jgi:hypothetical protein
MMLQVGTLVVFKEPPPDKVFHRMIYERLKGQVGVVKENISTAEDLAPNEVRVHWDSGRQWHHYVETLDVLR